MNYKFYLSLFLAGSLMSCNDEEKASEIKLNNNQLTKAKIFSISDAKSNLSFAKNQYLKLINNVSLNKILLYSKVCLDNTSLCIPRAEEHGAIYMERPKKWTNGFYPGLLWKILAAKSVINDFTDEQEALMKKTASTYQYALFNESVEVIPMT